MKYRTIVADPPWPIRWSGGQRRAGASSGSTRVYEKPKLPYSTMTLAEIGALGVTELADDDAHLFLWTLDRFVVEGAAAQIVRAWGFEALPQMLVWRKANPGLGRYIRSAHELIVVGRRGQARLNEVSTTSVHDWPQVYGSNGAKIHSAKPEAALDLIERLSDGPYLELFARRNRFGWDTWGNEAIESVEISDVR